MNIKVGGRGTEKGTQEDKLRAQVPSSRPGSPSAHRGMGKGGGLLGAVTRDSRGQHTSRGHHPRSAGLLGPGRSTSLQNGRDAMANSGVGSNRGLASNLVPATCNLGAQVPPL